VTQIVITQGGAVASTIRVESGLLSRPDLVDLIKGHLPGSPRTAVFGQPGSEGIARKVAERLDAGLRVLPDREDAKQLDVVEEAYLWLNDLAFTRNDLVVAVGGGALTDVVGFVAATYLRGVPVVLLPTTLLGAVDAAIGGKTGVNVGGKNLAGVFRHPEKVFIDTGVIAALPPELLREGAAEAVKAGWIGDPELVRIYETRGLDAPVDDVVRRAVAVKAAVVSADFREAGRRAWLNYGHTVGHAVEMAAGISHGAAVSIGMVAAGAVSKTKAGFGEAERQRAILEKLGLPVVSPQLPFADVTRLMALDKKRDDGGLRMTLLRGIADPVVLPVTDSEVRDGLAAVGIS
jgi:3-dehydroquinate synthase